MTDHDSMCTSQEFLPADLTRFCDCERVQAIRADEQERHGNNCGGMWDEWTHDLRAQVAAAFAETLPPYLFRHNEDVLFPKMERTMLNDAIRDVWQAAEDQVLALLDGDE